MPYPLRVHAMAPAPASLLQRCGDALRRLLPEAIAAYAFGSIVEGRAHVDSDMDLAVLVEQALEPMRRLRLQR